MLSSKRLVLAESLDVGGAFAPKNVGLLSESQLAVMTVLSEHREASADLLIDATGLPAATVLKELTLLTLKGKVRRVDAQTYAVRT